MELNLKKLTRAEVAILLCATEKSIDIWRTSKDLPCHTPDGSRTFYIWNEVFEWSKNKIKAETANKIKPISTSTMVESVEDLKKAGIILDNQLKQLSVDEKSRVLLPAEKVEAVWSEAVLKTKTKLLSLPSVVAPRLVGMDTQEIQDELDNHIYLALAEMAVSCLDDQEGNEEADNDE